MQIIITQIIFPLYVFRFPFSAFRFPFPVFRFLFPAFRFPFSAFRFPLSKVNVRKQFAERQHRWVDFHHLVELLARQVGLVFNVFGNNSNIEAK